MAKKESTRGSDLADRLFGGIREAEWAAVPGARILPILTGVTIKGVFYEPVENVLTKTIDILIGSKRVFLYGDGVYQEFDLHDGAGARLVPLRSGSKVETAAASRLANILICQTEDVQFPPTPPLVGLVLHAESVLARLPRIDVYARQPIFDTDFVLRGPGWHPDRQIMVHGPAFEPVLSPAKHSGDVCDRLPPCLRTVLQGFCFRSAADVVNAIALMLTGVLLNHFVASTRAIAQFDGNQPGVGKTLLARLIAIVLGGRDPRPIHYTADQEELAKRICAHIRDPLTSVLLFDNAKVRGSSVVDRPVIEANSMAPEICLRLLGQSVNVTRPNDVLWMMTMNNSQLSSDMVSRCLPIRLEHEGDASQRTFLGPDPIAYAMEHRAELFGELAGMVVRWNQLGRPNGTQRHRCSFWARTIGGILHAAGLPEFLANASEAAVAFDSAMDDLAALAEAAATAGAAFTVIVNSLNVAPNMDKDEQHGSPAADWVQVFPNAKVLVEELSTAKNSRARAIKIGQFLGKHLGRPVPIQVRGHSATAVLRVCEARAHQRRYYFEIAYDADKTPPTSASVEVSTAECAAHQRSSNEAVTLQCQPAPRAGQAESAATTEFRSTQQASDTSLTAESHGVPEPTVTPPQANGGNTEAW